MGDVLGKHWHSSDGYHIDVTGLTPPEPMVAILELIERPGMNGPVIVHHDREPMHLYPELIERGWVHEIISSEPCKVNLRLTRWL